MQPKKKGPKHNRQAVLDFIIRYKQEHDGNSPSMRQIGHAFDITSTSLLDYILDDLVDAGKILRDGSRGIQVIGGRWHYTPLAD